LVYDDLDRLTLAEYDVIDGSDEVFAIDDLGNRDMVNVRNGNNVDYVIDANTNVPAVCGPPLRQTGKPSSENARQTLIFPNRKNLYGILRVEKEIADESRSSSARVCHITSRLREERKAERRRLLYRVDKGTNH